MIYEFDLAAGLYLGAVDPAESGWPPGWTNEQPPATDAGQQLRWSYPGWIVEPIDFSQRSLHSVRAARLAALAAYRYEREVGGAVVAGIALSTDRESRALLTGAAVAAMLDPGLVTAWKAGSGWVDLDAAATIAVASAVRAHVQACFDRERALAQAIAEAGHVVAIEQLDITVGWPASA